VFTVWDLNLTKKLFFITYRYQYLLLTIVLSVLLRFWLQITLLVSLNFSYKVWPAVEDFMRLKFQFTVRPKNLICIAQSMSITTNIVSLNPAHGKVYLIQHYVIKFVSDLWQISGFLWVSSTTGNNTDHHDITEILLKV
jgi:hypothetical protein